MTSEQFEAIVGAFGGRLKDLPAKEKGDAAASPNENNLSTSYPQVGFYTMKLKKQVRQVLEQHGIPSSAVCKTAGGHIRIKLSRCVIFTGSTPSDRRSVKNLAAQLKRGGAA